jgi:hypothetical protein
MGAIKHLICRKCNNEWDLYTGYGMNSIIYTCNNCNEQKTIDPTYKDQISLNCDCGGLYMIDPGKYVCPDTDCLSNDIEVSDIGLWD